MQCEKYLQAALVAMLDEFLLIFIPMFVVIDPFGVMPIYLVMTRSMAERDRAKTLRYSIVFATALLLAFALVGKAVLDYLSVSIDALMITGGLLLLVIGVSMLYEGDAPRSRRKGVEEAEASQHVPEDVAFVPLGTPMIAGPGAISVVIVLTGTGDIPLVILSLLAIMAISAAILWQVGLVYRLIGNAGTRALTRVMGLITSAYAVQMILDGVTGYYTTTFA
ncbi:MAG: MarC family protein [Methanobacteriota archaeon]|nr:MAG: MarC family protein [Euryarchaeota archaeon]